MTDSIMQNYNQLREQVINGDRRFQHKDGHLCFEGVDLDALARQYPTPFYVFSEPEIIRNIHEIQQAFAAHKNTKTFFASKTCSVMGVLKAIRDAGICAEANSQYEVRKCLEIGFRGDQIVFNGVVKKPADDAARDKYAHFREINSTVAMFQYLQKNYNPTDSSFL